jgi:fatty-acyl-CoA synthase
VIRGGENISPFEIEEFLCRHPRIQSAQVVGVADLKYGEELCAWIVLTQGDDDFGEKEVRDFCKGSIAHYKVPKYIRIVADFPMTVTGKIQKFRIREEMERQLELKRETTA